MLMYKENRNNKGECVMLELKEKREGKEILEEDVDLLKVTAHPVQLQIVNELMYHENCNVT